MDTIDDKLLSFSEIMRYKECPMKFWFAKLSVSKDEIPEPLMLQFGSQVHNNIKMYYEDLSKGERKPPLSLFYLKRGLSGFRSINKIAQNFEFFEKNRKFLGLIPCEVEKYYKNDLYRGKVDAIFRDNEGRLIIYDWKSFRIHSSYKFQGYIYSKLTGIKDVRFYSLYYGETINMSPEDFMQGSLVVSNVRQEIDNDRNNGIMSIQRNRSSVVCKTCPYQSHCRLLDVKN